MISSMAVSGKKAETPIKGWLDSDSDQNCDPCKTDSQNVRARGYCDDCQEYLCSTCLSSHRKTKASKHHKIHEKSDDTSSSILDDKCPLHNNEIIKFFCPIHEELGCHDCMVLKHRTCDLDYIPDMCKGIADSKEYNDTIKLLESKIKASEDIEKEIEAKTTESEKNFDQVLKDIEEFESEVINRIKKMRKKVVEKASEIIEANKKVLKTIQERYTKVSSDLRQLQTSLIDNKASEKEKETYIVLKKAKSVADDDQETKTLKELSGLKIRFNFKRNEDIEKILSIDTVLGKLETKKRSISSLQNLKDINIRTHSDKNACGISGCVFIQPNKLLLVDWNNRKIKLFDINNDRLVQEQEDMDEPRGVTLLSQDEVAVSMIKMRGIKVVKTDDNLSLVRTVQLDRKCFNVTNNKGKIYVVCWDPESVLVLDHNGTIQTEILLNTSTIKITNPFGIAVSSDSEYGYVSDCYGKDSKIVRFTNNGAVSSVYEDKKIKLPAGILYLEDGSLLVCCLNSNIIYKISEDFKTGFDVLNKITSPKCICKDDKGDKIYIGCWSDTLKVYKIVYGK